MQGTQTCYHDAAKAKKASVTQYDDGKEVGPRREYRDDGTLERVFHFKPNVGSYSSEELYYETGGIRRAEFAGPESHVTIHYTVAGEIHRIACLPGASGGYSYSVAECQPKVRFPIAKWRPAK